jgi:NAD(P)H-quinone oxidoreductase subunit 5
MQHTRRSLIDELEYVYYNSQIMSSLTKPILVFHWILFALCIVLGVYYFYHGGVVLYGFDTSLFREEISLSIRIDFLTVLLLFMASSLTVAIAQYALRYLAGEKQQGYFYKYLCSTSVSVTVFLVSQNLLLMFLALLVISYSLNRLLTIYPERSSGNDAATKECILSRVADVLLVISLVLIYTTWGTFRIDSLSMVIAESLAQGESSALFSVVALLIALAAIIKSVQFPFHFWLPDTMETPAPVSALMHAGILNAGGILVIKSGAFISHSVSASMLMVIFGSVTAVFASLVMITQNDFKKKLAYSTVSQMGMMMLACGLQLYSVALFHIFAHSFYKAKAFLSIGSIIEESKRIQCKQQSSGTLVLCCTIFLGVIIIYAASTTQKYFNTAYAIYFAILFIGLVDGMLVKGFRPGFVGALLKSAGIILGAIILYILIETVLDNRTRDTFLQEGGAPSDDRIFILYVGYLAYALFSLGLYLSNKILVPKNHMLEKLYVYFWNGGYLPVITTRMLDRCIGKRRSGAIC